MRSSESFLVAVLLIVAVAFSSGCDTGPASRQRVDGDWFESSLVEHNLAIWLRVSPAANGYFLSRFDRNWVPLKEPQDTLVTQGRLIYAMATGYEVTGDEAYLSAMQRGVDFLLKNQRDPETGTWYRRVDASGQPTLKGVHRYGNAFVIFGLAHAARVTGDMELRIPALQTLDREVTALAAHPRAADYFPHRVVPDTSIYKQLTRQGKFRRAGDQNSLLHLFEASLELYAVAPSESLLADIRGIADFVIEVVSIARGRIVPSWHDRFWNPLLKDGGEVDPGHQLEWAHFLDRAVQLGLPQEYRAVAERMLEFPLMYGFHPQEGGLVTGLDYQGNIVADSRYYWEQAEALSALMHFAHWNGRDDLWPLFDAQLSFIRRHMMDTEYGGWFADSRGSAAFGNGDQLDAWQYKRDVYHIVNMHREALQIAGKLKRPVPGGS